MYQTPLLAIVGPTAVGKSTIAIKIAERIDGEIIGLDSRQVYAGMEIGTAQPTKLEQSRIQHHLIGIRMPDKAISAGEYAILVSGVIEDITQRGHQPILCGGAGLYYRAILFGIFPGSVTDLEIRERLNHEYEVHGAEQLINRLKDIDSDYAEIVHPNNKKRLVRALEIYDSTGKTPTEHYLEQSALKNNEPLIFTVLVTMDMSDLELRIKKRTASMLASGWVGEVERLRVNKKENLHPLDSIGYRQIMAHLNGDLSYDEMVDEINTKTRQYARRQLQWFKKEPIDLEIDLTGIPNIADPIKQIIRAFLSFIKKYPD